MRSFKSIRLAALGAALAGAAIGAAPATAAPGTTCTFDPVTRTATVFDRSGGDRMDLTIQNGFITADGNQLCISSGFEFATPTNTDRIDIVRHQPEAGSTNDGVGINESGGVFGPGATPESDGNSEIEISVLDDPGVLSDVTIFGTSGDDTIRAGGHGRIGFGLDNDVDVTALQMRTLFVEAEGGNDFLSARGFGRLVPLVSRVNFSGDDGGDTVVDSLQDGDRIFGGDGNDKLFALDGKQDFVSGGPGFDQSTLDASDSLFRGNDVEQRTNGTVGRLRLAPRALAARAGKTARLRLSWTHPRSWRRLRMINLTLYRGTDPLGTVHLRPSDGRLTGDGALKLQPRASRLTRSGKTVTAQLAFVLPRSLAGQELRLGVEAADRDGGRQVVPEAGSISVAR